MSYDYDAWGKPTITNVAGTTESANLIARNPYLYRGYRYDHETGLYYLNSRYYDPETGRFVNGDAMVSTNQGIHSTNMFAYCENNPVMGGDPSGYIPMRMYSVLMTDGGDHSRNPKPTPKIRDVTEEVDNALRGYVELGLVLSPYVLPTPGPLAREAIKYKVFYNWVKDKGPWDIKRKKSWEKTIGTPKVVRQNA